MSKDKKYANLNQRFRVYEHCAKHRSLTWVIRRLTRVTKYWLESHLNLLMKRGLRIRDDVVVIDWLEYWGRSRLMMWGKSGYAQFG